MFFLLLFTFPTHLKTLLMTSCEMLILFSQDSKEVFSFLFSHIKALAHIYLSEN